MRTYRDLLELSVSQSNQSAIDDCKWSSIHEIVEPCKVAHNIFRDFTSLLGHRHISTSSRSGQFKFRAVTSKEQTEA